MKESSATEGVKRDHYIRHSRREK